MTDEPDLRIGVVGASGFIGSNLMAWAQVQGIEVAGVTVPRVSPGISSPNDGLIDILARHLDGFDVVVNAAGMAEPGSRDVSALEAANVVLPTLLACACKRAGVRRLVHVSSAVVQGRLNPLDESSVRRPFSPYSHSKARGEEALERADSDHRPDEVVLYRPGSVHGPGRSQTRALVRTARRPIVVVAGAGDQPLPVALVRNVAAGTLFAATSKDVIPVAAHPWEGLTARSLFELLGARRFVAIPGPLARSALRAAWAASGSIPAATSRVRRLELLLTGQGVAESRLSRAGFVAPLGPEGWTKLAESESEAHVSDGVASFARCVSSRVAR